MKRVRVLQITYLHNCGSLLWCSKYDLPVDSKDERCVEGAREDGIDCEGKSSITAEEVGAIGREGDDEFEAAIEGSGEGSGEDSGVWVGTEMCVQRR